MTQSTPGRFDDELLQAWMNTHYGYGNYGGDYWFIGMEEGCRGCTHAEISSRMQVWHERGRHELDDVRSYHMALGVIWPFEGAPRLQPTWKGLIRIVLSGRNTGLTSDDLRAYQRDRLARHDGETCLLEFLPLPSRSTAHWLYGDHSQIPFLVNRRRYREACAPWRAEHIKQRIDEHQPKAVIFYSTNKWYRQWWDVIADVPLTHQETNGLYVGRSALTTFVVMKHPTAHGVSKESLERVGELISCD